MRTQHIHQEQKHRSLRDRYDNWLLGPFAEEDIPVPEYFVKAKARISVLIGIFTVTYAGWIGWTLTGYFL